MNRKLRIVLTLLVVAVGLFLIWKSVSNKMARLEGSEESLSVSIAQRWGGGLPDGYTKEVADDLEADGYLLARLTYQEDVSDQLQAWGEAEEAEINAFFNLREAHLQEKDLPETHRKLLEDVQPQPGEGWLGYLGEQPEGQAGQIVLLYDPDNWILYVAEYWPPEA